MLETVLSHLKSVRFVFWAPTAVRQRSPLLTYFQLGFLGNHVLQVVFRSYTWPPGNLFSEEFVLRSLIVSQFYNRAPLKAWWVARGIVCIFLGRI